MVMFLRVSVAFSFTAAKNPRGVRSARSAAEAASAAPASGVSGGGAARETLRAARPRAYGDVGRSRRGATPLAGFHRARHELDRADSGQAAARASFDCRGGRCRATSVVRAASLG